MGCCKIFQKTIYCAKLTSRNETVVSLNVPGREGTRNLFEILAEQLSFPYNCEHFKHYCILHQYRHFEFTYQCQFFLCVRSRANPKSYHFINGAVNYLLTYQILLKFSFVFRLWKPLKISKNVWVFLPWNTLTFKMLCCFHVSDHNFHHFFIDLLFKVHVSGMRLHYVQLFLILPSTTKKGVLKYSLCN